MESIRLSFQAVMPIFILMLLGYFIKKTKLADKKSLNVINKLIFKIFLPVLLFYNIYSTKTSDVFDVWLVVYTVVGILFIFVLGYFSVMLLTKDNAKRGVMLQGFFRANYAILGVPLVNYICGDKTSGLASLMVVVVIPMFNVLAVIALERFRKGNSKLDILKLLKGVITNPLIIGCIIGLLFFVLDIKLPAIIEKSVKDVASIATPLAIIVLGSVFEFSDIKGYFRENVIVVVSRLVIVPLIIIPVAVWLGFTGEALACLLVIFATPIAVSSLAMTQQMDGDEVLATQVIVISSAVCLVTLFLWIFVLNFMGLF
ncbi:MAG: AEC family transporter [Clostridia bacterium]|nr:AEC family transporter [Clostridia bacterium]